MTPGIDPYQPDEAAILQNYFDSVTYSRNLDPSDVAVDDDQAPVASWITMGNPVHRHPEELANAAFTGDVVDWTIPAKAHAGEHVFFYITGIKQIVAHGVTQHAAETRDTDRRGRWYTHIENITLIQPLDLRVLRVQFPDWGWAKYPRHHARIPEEIADVLLDDRTLNRLDKADSAVENVITERQILARSRNRGLRDSCVEASSGVCAGCGYDYAAIATTSWRSILQAHHKTPLSLSDREQVTKVRDLIAYCPTCHVMAHLRRPKPYSARNIADRYGGKTFFP